MPTDEEIAKLRERERVELSLSAAESGEQQPREEVTKSALSAGCVTYTIALLLAVAGVVVMVSSQPIAIVLIAAAVAIGFWARSKLKQAEQSAR
jgi:hypothetical protein